MPRQIIRHLVFAGIVVVVASVQAPGRQATGRSIALKVLLPQEDAALTVNGKSIAGKGIARTAKVEIPTGAKSLSVCATWEPNNYTKIERKWKVAAGNLDKVTVDLRKADPVQPDDIVVRYVPTPQDVADAMCKIAHVGPNDVVYDLGCGDGRIVITAVKKYMAKRGVGIDLDPERIKESKENADLQRVDDKLEFRVGDVLKIKDLPEATVVMLYMGDDINLRLRPLLKKALRPGARIVSHRFRLGDWEPERTITVNSTAGYPCQVHLWEVKESRK
jgi:predicted RNA methylase